MVRVSVLLGYARVSTAEQNADLQTDELTPSGVLMRCSSTTHPACWTAGEALCLPASAGSAVGVGQ